MTHLPAAPSAQVAQEGGGVAPATPDEWAGFVSEIKAASTLEVMRQVLRRKLDELNVAPGVEGTKK